MATPQLPKYQVIYSTLRQQILDGAFTPGERLPAQQELADSFGVTLMTLRQAMAALESDGLVWAERGKGTFVSERPVDIRVGNLSSFAQQMHSAGIEMTTEVVAVDSIASGDVVEVAAALGHEGDLCCITRRRTVGGVPMSLQRSYLAKDSAPSDPFTEIVNDSLYDTIEAATGWTVVDARESITAIAVNEADAAMLGIEPGHPALLSIRTSMNQFGQPFLHDLAILVGGRTTLTADRTADRLSLNYGYQAN